MQVAVKDQKDTYKPYLPHEEHVGKTTSKADQQVTSLEEKGSLICTGKLVAQTIESLLPDEEDLFSGLINELRCTATGNGGKEDFDLFSSNGGMELEEDSKLHLQQRNYVAAEEFLSHQNSADYLIACEHPTRILVVKNVDNSVEDSELRVLFEQYGDIRTFYTTCRYQGLVIISYYDIRAARSALSTLQNTPMQNGKLHIHFSNPKDDPSEQYTDHASLDVFNYDSSVSSDKLHKIFASFGEIEEISGTTPHHIHLKYYDIRAAEAAVSGLNSSSMLQKKIKLEISYPGCAKSSVQEFSHGLLECQLGSRQSPNGISVPQVVNSYMKDGYINGVESLHEISIKAFPKNAPVPANCCFTNSLPSAVGMESVYNRFGLHEPHYSLDQAKLHNRCPDFHPQPFSINCGGFVDNGAITYNTLSTLGDLTTETNDKHLHTPGSYSPPVEHLFGGSLRTGSLPLIGNHHVWNPSNSFQHHHLYPMIWSHSPTFNNGVCAHGTSKLPVLLEVLPPVLYTVPPKQQMNGSATSGNLSCEDSQHAYMGKSFNADYHVNPLQVVGFPTTMLHPVKIASHDFSQVTGNCMDACSNSTMFCPIISHKSPERDVEAISPISLSRPKGRVRRLSQRRHETVSCYTDEKKYELDIERVLRGEDNRTTLMIKNIPNKYSSETLLAAIDEHNQGTYDFLYLPLDFKNKCNMGYAFINMIDPLQIVQFHKSFNGKKWEKFHSGKVACLAYARIQGKAALIAHFQESSLMNEDKCCHPILFSTDGPNAGNQEPFPLGTSVHSRRHRNRCNLGETNQNQDNLSTSLEGETSYHIKDTI